MFGFQNKNVDTILNGTYRTVVFLYITQWKLLWNCFFKVAEIVPYIQRKLIPQIIGILVQTILSQKKRLKFKYSWDNFIKEM